VKTKIFKINSCSKLVEIRCNCKKGKKVDQVGITWLNRVKGIERIKVGMEIRIAQV